MRCRCTLLCVPAVLASCHAVFPHRGPSTDAGAADVGGAADAPRPRVDGAPDAVDLRVDAAGADQKGADQKGADQKGADQKVADQKVADLPLLPPPRVWAWENPIPTWSRLTSVWAAPAKDVAFAVGLEGTLLRHDVIGKQITSHKVPGADPSADLFGVWGRSSSEVYAVGDQVILEYKGGSTWLPTQVSATLRAISGNATTLFAVGEAGGAGVFLSGTSPSSMTTKTVNKPLHAVWADTTKAYAAGDQVDAGLYVHSAGVVSLWEKPFFYTTNLSARALWASPAAIFVAGRYSSSGFLTERSGSPPAWHNFPTSIGSSANGLWGDGTGTYGVGSGTSLLKHDPALKSWNIVQAPNPWGGSFGTPLNAIWGAGTPAQLFVVGDYGLVATGTPAVGFESVSGASANRTDLVSLWSSAAETIAVGGSTILRRVNAADWKQQNPPALAQAYITAVWGRGQEVFLAACKPASYPSTLYRWNLTTGATVELTPPAGALPERFAAIWGGSGSMDKVYFAGDDATIWVLDPASAKPATLGVVHHGTAAPSLQSIWGWPEAAPDTVVAIGPAVFLKVVKGVPSSGSPPTPISRGIWGSTLTDLTVVSDQGIHRPVGTIWSTNTSFGECYSIWGASPKEVYALCAKGVARWDGSTWKGELLPNPPARRIDELGGTLFGYARSTGPAALTIVGRGGAILRSE